MTEVPPLTWWPVKNGDGFGDCDGDGDDFGDGDGPLKMGLIYIAMDC